MELKNNISSLNSLRYDYIDINEEVAPLASVGNHVPNLTDPKIDCILPLALEVAKLSVQVVTRAFVDFQL